MAHSLRVPSQEWLRFAAILRGPLSIRSLAFGGGRNHANASCTAGKQSVPGNYACVLLSIGPREQNGFFRALFFLFGAIACLCGQK
mmetsp:Transcript_21017/g.54789  ORF Transcript_21017/g.54789 Transcript_21017/m.54789 type:complete len:86 (+) Transcript_21017:5286-5543(+)